MGYLEKGRLFAYGISEAGSELNSQEASWFEEWAKLNFHSKRIEKAVNYNPLKLTKFQLQNGHSDDD